MFFLNRLVSSARDLPEADDLLLACSETAAHRDRDHLVIGPVENDDFSGVYLVIAGPIPDPLPFIDEATALLIFVKSMGYLGYDVRRWLPFLRKGKGSKARPAGGPRDVTIDV